MNPVSSVLIIDDEVQLCKLIARKLKKINIQSYLAHDGSTALSTLRKEKIEAVILDYMLPDMTGLDILKEIQESDLEIPVIMLTAYGNVESAVNAMKLGAVDYLNKPVELEELANLVLQISPTKARNRNEKSRSHTFKFKSEQMKRMMDLLKQVKETDASILILGESGVGKTALARWIHENSNRTKGPFLSINCAAISESMLERELFGDQERAQNSNEGKFAKANGGTIFLDEIGEMRPNIQAKLLYMIENKVVMDFNTNEYKPVDVKVISATNQPLKELVKSGKFREDLYYRLNLIEVELPPLRQRKVDIPILIQHQLAQLNNKYNKKISIDQASISILVHYHWLGNIRELLNVLERVHILKRSGTITPEDLVHASLQFEHDVPVSSDLNETFFSGNLPQVLEEVEEKMIKQALAETIGNQTKAAEKLGIARHTLIYKMKKYDLKV
ncbi:hypothetical protein BTR22_07100 [Alkalihalophilus pseudofirmus]|uniref:sigma-54-dependent transcriptional regulator n=1 Tax=Alkalihalophilus pseudofirmus TaxID=79885 RepID=UPI0009534289|nr:hypothetical protein BTR22_07100 [Alkalihalophilus pseudofirmus]